MPSGIPQDSQVQRQPQIAPVAPAGVIPKCRGSFHSARNVPDHALRKQEGNTRDAQWSQHDSVELVKASLVETRHSLPILIDQGESDNFLEEQLKIQLLQDAATSTNFPMQIRMQPGYDHSYFFIATFIDEHISFHAHALID